MIHQIGKYKDSDSLTTLLPPKTLKIGLGEDSRFVLVVQLSSESFIDYGAFTLTNTENGWVPKSKKTEQTINNLIARHVAKNRKIAFVPVNVFATMLMQTGRIDD